MKDQLKTIREFIKSVHVGEWTGNVSRKEALATLTQLEAMAEQKPVAWIRGSGIEMLKLENGGCATVYASEGMSNHSSPLYAAPVAQQYEAGDMASAAAQGFRDGVASVAQQPSKATLEKLRAWETNGELIDRAWQVLQSQEQEIMRLEKMLAEERAQQPQAEAVPPGYVLVPVEPSDAFVRRAKNHGVWTEQEVRNLYDDIIAAAPTVSRPQSMPSDQQIEQWADDFITSTAYNRSVAIQIATKAAQWVREQIAAPQQAEAVPSDVLGSEWAPCIKRPVVVHVRNQRPGEKHVSTREGITPVKPDDLIMRGVSGEEYPIGRAIFDQTYDLVDADIAQQKGQP